MKKVIKIIMLAIMLLGIAFSISNFMQMELKAVKVEHGIWVYVAGGWECADLGNECVLGGDIEED